MVAYKCPEIPASDCRLHQKLHLPFPHSTAQARNEGKDLHTIQMISALTLVLALCLALAVVGNVIDLAVLKKTSRRLQGGCHTYCYAPGDCYTYCGSGDGTVSTTLNPNAVAVTVPFSYPLFKQCDSAWGNDLMGNKTICSVGCLMSSTASGLAGVGIKIPQPNNASPSNANPGSFNAWLQLNGGYDNNSLIESVVPKIDPSRISWPDDAFHPTNDLPFKTVCDYIKQGRIVVGNVHNGGHFVLLIGYSETDGDTFAVNDSGFDTATYSYSKDIVGYRIFDMVRK